MTVYVTRESDVGLVLGGLHALLEGVQNFADLLLDQFGRERQRKPLAARGRFPRSAAGPTQERQT
jgi:hypothetical protein